METIKSIWDFIIIKIFLKTIIPITFFALAIYFAFIDKTPQMAIFVATGFLFIFMFYADKLSGFFKLVRVGGLEIELRELKNELVELKMVAKLSSEGLLNITNHLGCFYSSEIEILKDKIYNESMCILNVLKIPKTEIRKMTEKWHKRNEENYFYNIYKKLDSSLMEEKSDNTAELREKYKKIKNKTPEILENLLGEFESKNNQKLKKCLEDYKYYVKNKEHKDFKRWLKLCGADEE